MSVIWVGLVIYAVIEAVAAAGRVGQKRQQAKGMRASRGASRRGGQTVQQLPGSPEAAGASQESSQAGTPAQSEPRPIALAAPSLLVEPELLQSPELQSPAELDLPLAVSVSVTDLARSELPVTTSTIELVPPELALPEVESIKADRQPQASAHQSILAEIAELGQSSTDRGTDRGTGTGNDMGTDAVSYFQRSLNHPDDVVRAATVFELGELAAQRQGAEAAKILDLLMPLNQDPDPEVRSQVLVALAKIQSIIS